MGLSRATPQHELGMSWHYTLPQLLPRLPHTWGTLPLHMSRLNKQSSTQHLKGKLLQACGSQFFST